MIYFLLFEVSLVHGGSKVFFYNECLNWSERNSEIDYLGLNFQFVASVEMKLSFVVTRMYHSLVKIILTPLVTGKHLWYCYRFNKKKSFWSADKCMNNNRGLRWHTSGTILPFILYIWARNIIFTYVSIFRGQNSVTLNCGTTALSPQTCLNLLPFDLKNSIMKAWS